ncbi:hypothetical protein JOF53_000237 [Crossiella equi]|uniref:DUF4333 domain-containing protein n=1 Tax=Crossiella equi TaxID=130796 RepID=A0ABS5A467_9PSEU|nr:DUF4333 domain-containing protein [Crossiella equi]MBP2471365.1 hypothetical protein [Crossiella equi]
MIKWGPWGLVCLGVLVAGCAQRPAAPPAPEQATRVFELDRLEFGVRAALVDRYQLKGLELVRCPPGQPVVAQRRFSCEATVSGHRRQVEVTVRDAGGGLDVGAPR